MLKNWKNWITWMFSPMAIGFYITMVAVALNFKYYEYTSQPAGERPNSGFSNLVFTAHQKSIDYRMRVRGPRPVHPDIALLTVDERALETIGRWPWPRDVLAGAIEQAMNNGVKVMAFDMVFSEPQLNPAVQVYEKAKAIGKLSPEAEQAILDFRDELDADKALGAVFAKFSDRIVAGSFAAVPMPKVEPESEFCRDLIFKKSPPAKQWDKEEVLISVKDSSLPYVPAGLLEITDLLLEDKANEVREAFGPVKNRSDEVRLEQALFLELNDRCNTLLTDPSLDIGAAWKEAVLAKENPKEFTFATYEDWLADFREHSRPYAIPAHDLWKLNAPAIAAGTKHTGQFNTEIDSDGTIRSKNLILRTGNSYFPGIALKAFLVANNFNATPVIEYNPASKFKEVTEIEITNNETGDTVFKIPVDYQGRMMINYAGPEKMYPYVSFADLVNDSPDLHIEQKMKNPETGRWEERKNLTVKKAEFLKNKILVVGATATGIYDLRVTPFQENYPGAETHLNIIDNILSKSFYKGLPDEPVMMPMILAVVGLVMSIILAYSGAVVGILLTAALMAGFWWLDVTYLFGKGMIVTVIWPILLVATLYIFLTFYRYLTEERGKKELRQTFQKYVSPAIVEEILSDPKNIELGGKKVHLTVMFSDVRGFTTISEKLDPRALSDLLNSYLTPMTEIVFKNRGTLDKYMGDAIMAFFGAPITYKDHAKYACRCALQSVEKLFELQKEWEKKGLPTIDLGIGLNTGDVSVGNMGSETVRSYTVMGDAVNLASRLEGINKTYGTRIILSEMTYNEVKDSFICREVDWVRVKGKVLPVKIYELIAENKLPSASLGESIKFYQEGYNHYHARAWAKGAECFKKALEITPNDEVSKLYLERCQDFLAEPPEDTWDGVYTMKTK